MTHQLMDTDALIKIIASNPISNFAHYALDQALPTLESRDVPDATKQKLVEALLGSERFMQYYSPRLKALLDGPLDLTLVFHDGKGIRDQSSSDGYPMEPHWARAASKRIPVRPELSSASSRPKATRAPG
jgi:hypothetical protein